MSSVNIVFQHQGLTAAQLRQTMAGASLRRTAGTFISPDNMLNIPVPANANIPLAIDQGASAIGKPRSANATDYISQFEKDFAVNELQNQGFQVDARDTTKRYGAAKEWDGFVLSMDGLSPTDTTKVRDIFLKRIGSPEQLGSVDAAGNVIPFKGMHGQRAIYIAEEHTNTGHTHYHIFANRFAFDMQNRQVSKGVDLSKTGDIATFLANIESDIKAAGIDASIMTGGVSATKNITQNQQLQSVKDTVAQLTQDAGGVSPGQDSTLVLVPHAEHGNLPVMAPMMGDAKELNTAANDILTSATKRRAALEEEMRRTETEIKNAVLLQQAAQALAENEVLKNTILEKDSTITKVEQDKEELQKEFDTLKGDNEILATEKKGLEENLETINTSLADLQANNDTVRRDLEERAPFLNLPEDIQSGLEDGSTFYKAIEHVTNDAATWGEALGNLPDERANELRQDPVGVLPDLVEKADQSVVFMLAINNLANAVPINAELKQTLLDDPAKGLVGLAEAFKGLQTDLSNQQIRHEGAVEALTKQHANERAAMEQAHAKAVERSQAEITRLTEERDQALEEAASLRSTLKDVSKQLDVYLELAPTADDDKHFSSDEMKLKVLGKLAELQEKREELNADLTAKTIEIETLGERIKAVAANGVITNGVITNGVITYSNGKSDDVKALRTTYEQLAANHKDRVKKGYEASAEPEPKTPLERTQAALDVQAEHTEKVNGVKSKYSLDTANAAKVVKIEDFISSNAGRELAKALQKAHYNKTSTLKPKDLADSIAKNPEAFLQLATQLTQNLDQLKDIPKQGLTPPSPGFSGYEEPSRGLSNDGNGPKTPGEDDDFTRNR